MKSKTNSRLFMNLITLSFVTIASSAHADLIFTLTPATDGGVELVGTGTSTGELKNALGNSFSLFFAGNNVLGNRGPETTSDSETGTATVGSFTGTVTGVVLSTFGFSDSIRINAVTGFEETGLVMVDMTANFNVDTLAFADLTPGTYAGQLPGTSVVVTAVPEPSSLIFGVVAGLVGLSTRRRPVAATKVG